MIDHHQIEDMQGMGAPKVELRASGLTEKQDSCSQGDLPAFLGGQLNVLLATLVAEAELSSNKKKNPLCQYAILTHNNCQETMPLSLDVS